MRTSPGGSEIYFIIELGLQLHKFITPINAVWTSFPDSWFVRNSERYVALSEKRHQARPVNSPLPGILGLLHHFRTNRNAITEDRVKGQVHNKRCGSRAEINSHILEWYRSYNEKEEPGKSFCWTVIPALRIGDCYTAGPFDGSEMWCGIRLTFIFVNERRRPPPASIPVRLTPGTDGDSSVPGMVNGPKTSQITKRRARTFLRMRPFQRG
ncbi:hypothetical protein C8J55DRAFT_491280 [Lentinula edodes]|uniref:Uncharacterized protein n=1 Tax=Lentinula lateritia TaxID=40482 RepID=A0A9W9A0Q8_9AGAR|nr:hypothetical protein C8J55DRAFT_491280 [Lentinula edodes]